MEVSGSEAQLGLFGWSLDKSFFLCIKSNIIMTLVTHAVSAFSSELAGMPATIKMPYLQWLFSSNIRCRVQPSLPSRSLFIHI